MPLLTDESTHAADDCHRSRYNRNGIPYYWWHWFRCRTTSENRCASADWNWRQSTKPQGPSGAGDTVHPFLARPAIWVVVLGLLTVLRLPTRTGRRATRLPYRPPVLYPHYL